VTPERETTSELEIAHVLFMDIVGYSKLPMDEQKSVLQELNKLVRETESFKHAEALNELIRLPTGDGMALVFFEHPEAPLRCAVELSRVLRNASKIKLRMGVHSGAVYRIKDINTGANVAGAGINMAQRVMDCGDAGHILVSATVAETVGQLSKWADKLHDLGDAEVKHGVRVHVFNIYADDYGSTATPEKLRYTTKPLPSLPVSPPSRVTPPSTSSTSLSSSPSNSAYAKPETFERQHISETPASTPAANGLRVALLYKRNAQPDERILKLLEDQLQQNGYKVFIDRHLSIGVEWAQEIERQVRTADAVVPLLSAASSVSEMLTYEIQIANEAAQQQNGKPRILPVRIDFEGALPDPLGSILAPIQYFLWTDPQNDSALVDQLLKSLRNPVVEKVAPQDLREPGGAVALDSKLYIVRPTDEEFLNAIKRRDSTVLVKGARQMGKTSLLARGVQQARQAGAKVVLTDFQVLNATHLASIDSLFQTLGGLIYDQLDLDVDPVDEWNPRRGASINFSRYMRKHVLGSLSAPLVWAMDEVDRLFTCDFGSEVFGLFRSWHNERSLDPTSPWERLTLAIVYATEANLFITDPNQSPFNIGTRLELSDFTFDQVAEMNQRIGSPLQGGSEIARFYRLLSGHPYLVHRGLYDMKTHNISLSAFEDLADRDEGPYGDHLRRMLVLLANDQALCEVVRAVLRGQPCPTPESFYRLRTAGVMAGDSARDARLRCQLYATYLERHLL
jgi:class 3 adenylate cyclase